MPNNVAETQDNCATSEDVTFLNDSEVIASDHPDLAGFYNKEFTFMTGNLYGQGDRRNTRDGDWKARTMTLLQWLQGGEGWGLSRHPEAKSKGGASITPSFNVAGKRADMAVKQMTAIGIDIDSGASLDDVADRLEASGYFGIIYTTYNHRKTVMELKHDTVVKKLALDDTPTLDQVREYLRLHHKDRFADDFIDQIEITDPRRHDANGLQIVLKTPPIDKFRVIFPLAEPVDLADLAPTMNGYKEAWADAVTGVAVNILESEFDSTSCDINRLFYTPRHAKGAEWYSAIIEGKPLAVEEIKPYSKTKYIAERKAAGDPFLAGDEGGTHNVPRVDTPSGLNLNDWHREFKERFEIADVLETYASDKVRTAGGERAGTVHIECPFEHTHSSTGGTATMAMNPDANENGVWTVFCKHDACQGRHKLEFLQQMVADEWFDESILKDTSFMVPAPDEDDGNLEDAIQSIGKFEATKEWLPKGYVVGDDMIFFQQTDGDEIQNIPVCGVFDVVGRTADPNGTEGAGRIISFKNENGIRAELTLDRASLYASGPDIVRKLADAGLPMEAGTQAANDRLLNLFRRMTPERLVPTLHKPGWHGDGFMLPTGHYIGGDAVRLHEDATVKVIDKKGTLEGWQGAANAALSHVEENPYWTLTTCAGFAGPLLDILEWNPVGFVLSGETSKGKSLGQSLAASIWTTPQDGKGVFWTASSTPNAYEDLAIYGSGTCLMMDELGAITDKRQLAPLIFVLHTGRGKARKRGNGPGLTRTAEFRPFVVFSSESNIKAEIEAAGVPYRGGMAARFPDVDVGSGKARSVKEIAKLEAVQKNYGHAGEVFIRHIMDKDTATLAKEVQEIVDTLADGQKPGLRRAARPFALAQRAGELAVDAGLLGNVSAVRRGVKLCWQSFLKSDEAATANGSESMLDSFRSWVGSEMDRTILKAFEPSPDDNDDEGDDKRDRAFLPDNHDARGPVIGWYTADTIYLDWKKLETLQIPGSFGKRAALCNALAEIDALDRSSASNIPYTNLPDFVASVSKGVGRTTKNMRIKRKEFGV